MKIYRLLAVLAALTFSVSVAEIPPRDPKLNESRPSWWWECWQEQVVVIEGVISYVEDNTPDVTVVLHNDALGMLDDDEVRVQKTFSHYYAGTVEAKKLLFAAPGSEQSDLRIGGLAQGVECTLRVLIPAQITEGAPGKIVRKEKAVIVLCPESMAGPFSYVVQAGIPNDDIKSAMKLFEHRKKFNHRKLAK